MFVDRPSLSAFATKFLGAEDYPKWMTTCMVRSVWSALSLNTLKLSSRLSKVRHYQPWYRHNTEIWGSAPAFKKKNRYWNDKWPTGKQTIELQRKRTEYGCTACLPAHNKDRPTPHCKRLGLQLEAQNRRDTETSAEALCEYVLAPEAVLICPHRTDRKRGNTLSRKAANKLE